MKLIVGAGLAGLIAGHAWPQATIIEAAPGPAPNHRALLRFRTDAVARLTGVEFRRVRVRKGIWMDGGFVAPNIRAANFYAQKVLGAGRLTSDRSIWSIDPVDRFIAPESLYEQLVDAMGSRIHWGCAADFGRCSAGTIACVNTAPLPVVLAALGNDQPHLLPEFRRAAIRVRRWRLRGADTFQTVYFPGPETPLYRASITGDLLIAECADRPMDPVTEEAMLDKIEAAFGLYLRGDAESVDTVVIQRYGKIEPISDEVRKSILFWLTHERGIYSLGRFATWRNILLDDVVDDIAVIKRLARSSSSAYDARKAAT